MGKLTSIKEYTVNNMSLIRDEMRSKIEEVEKFGIEKAEAMTEQVETAAKVNKELIENKEKIITEKVDKKLSDLNKFLEETLRELNK